ncbi:MAG: sulfite exporter TauE/SafE family protein [Actinobacteria bacterium]|nr:MAG: sulfite exporter TauE/SafE family protein [Actinomycetota bacterium]
MPSLIILALIGLAAQLVDGSLGMAYGVTSTTLLVAWGASPALASGSVHLAEVGTSLISGASHWRFGNIDRKVVLRLGVPGAAGAFLGATLLSNISTAVGRPVMSSILLVLGAVLLIRFAFRGLTTPKSNFGRRGRFLAPLGLIAGFIDATGGGGWGPIATPTMLISGRTELRKVIGSVSASEFLVSVAASVGFLVNLGGDGVDWTIAAALLAGGAVAAPVAALLVARVRPRILGTVVGGLILITNVRTLLIHFEVPAPVPLLVYGVLAVLWAWAVFAAVVGSKREAESAQPPAPANA